MAKLPFLLFRSLRLSHNSTCLCIEKCVRQSGQSLSYNVKNLIKYILELWKALSQKIFVGIFNIFIANSVSNEY